jgi:hypothetical protein
MLSYQKQIWTPTRLHSSQACFACPAPVQRRLLSQPLTVLTPSSIALPSPTPLSLHRKSSWSAFPRTRRSKSDQLPTIILFHSPPLHRRPSPRISSPPRNKGRHNLRQNKGCPRHLLISWSRTSTTTISTIYSTHSFEHVRPHRITTRPSWLTENYVCNVVNDDLKPDTILILLMSDTSRLPLHCSDWQSQSETRGYPLRLSLCGIYVATTTESRPPPLIDS